MDISNFISWFVSQVVSMFTNIFGILDSLTFGGTTLLRVIITITILIPLVGVILTIAPNPQSSRVRGYHEGFNEKRRERRESRKGGI